MQESKKYLLGLDIGTNSVGWCLTDDTYKIVKKGGKSLWGVRMFDEANSAAKRRSFRTARKNNNRKKERIDLLQSLIAEEMYKLDPTFFQRLDESFYHIEDRTNKNRYTLFNDGMTDYDYFKKFPTIYHLRQYLLNTKEKVDLRYIYLALSHMMKKRGHFLNSSPKFEVLNKEELNGYFEELNEKLTSLADAVDEESYFLYYNDTMFTKVRDAFIETKSRKDQLIAVDEIINEDNNKFIKNFIVRLLCGREINLKKIDFLDLEEDLKINVTKEELEEKIAEGRALIGEYDDFFDIIFICKKIHDFFFLGKLLGNHQYISSAMVEKYDTFQNDLKTLKSFVKQYVPSKYYECFRSMNEKSNYTHYVGVNKTGNTIQKTKKVKKDEFYSYLKTKIFNKSNLPEKAEKIKAEILLKIENNEFLSKIATTDNVVFPNQLNLEEMMLILDNQSKHYSFLNTYDEDNLTVQEKIISIFKHKIPYYVGPLNTKSPNAWIIRTKEKIYPWNFDKVVNLDASAKEFIFRMLNKCTYLKDCYCIAKNSLVFSEYNVLSVLNKISLNGSPLSQIEKEDIINNLFKKKRKVTKTQFLDYYKAKYGEDVTITTSNAKDIEEFNCDMASYYDFVKILGEEVVLKNKEIIDQLISDITIFEDKKILERRIKNEKEYALFRNYVSQIKGLNYKGYARISNKLLTEIYACDENGEVIGNIMDIMLATNCNLQEILAQYDFKEQIDNHNKKTDDTSLTIEEFIEKEVYVSPVMKRPLLQAYKIIEELEKIVKQDISEFYVETMRVKTKKEMKKRTTSRKEKARLLLNEAKNFAKEHIDAFISEKECNNLLKQLDNTEINKFQSDRYYLYFTQLGRCMYSLDPIDLESINGKQYDIDHIIPQTLYKDDSFSNRVLVKSTLNSQKDDTYPIPKTILHKNANQFYRFLQDKKLISSLKYDRLTKKELSDGDIQGFINRQIVVTNQAVLGLIKALKQFKNVDNSKIIYSKSENVSDFRHEFDIVKSRIANNFHHAHDAYLNIIVGRTVQKYFNTYVIKNQESIRYYNQNGITTNPINIFKAKTINIKGFEKYWNKDMIPTIKKNIYTRFDILTTTRVYTRNELHEASIQSADLCATKKDDLKFAIKPSHPIISNINKYGAIIKESFSHYSLVKEVDKKKKTNYVLTAIPRRFKDKEEEYLEILKNDKKLLSSETIIKNLKINTIIEQENLKYCITGKTGNTLLLKNLHERHFNEEVYRIITRLEKYVNKKLNNKEIEFPITQSGDLIISPARTVKNKAIIITLKETELLFSEIKKIYTKKEYGYLILQKISLFLDLNNFQNLEITNRLIVLSELMKLLMCNQRQTADLTLIGKEKSTGTLTTNSTLKPGMRIIYESITGYYRKTIWEYHK